MKSIVKCFGVAIVGIIAVVMTGCGLFESSGSSGTSNSATAIESVFQSALSAFATALSDGKTQQAAISIAEAIVSSKVDDESQQALFNSIIEAAVPAVASLASSLASNTSTTTATDSAATTTTTESKGMKVTKAKVSKSTIVDSDAFKAIVSDCVKKFQTAQKKAVK